MSSKIALSAAIVTLFLMQPQPALSWYDSEWNWHDDNWYGNESSDSGDMDDGGLPPAPCTCAVGEFSEYNSAGVLLYRECSIDWANTYGQVASSTLGGNGDITAPCDTGMCSNMPGICS